jgi:hypothetical protein
MSVKPPQIFQNTSTHGCCGGGGGGGGGCGCGCGCDLVQAMYVFVDLIRLKLFFPSFGALQSYWSIHVYDKQKKGHHMPSYDNM